MGTGCLASKQFGPLNRGPLLLLQVEDMVPHFAVLSMPFLGLVVTLELFVGHLLDFALFSLAFALALPNVLSLSLALANVLALALP